MIPSTHSHQDGANNEEGVSSSNIFETHEMIFKTCFISIIEVCLVLLVLEGIFYNFHCAVDNALQPTIYTLKSSINELH
jgi:hypothetical protein